ncbi:hypothetical protein OG21DRAFT_1490282 [Imleria badia]|nr:hypothetical protein OG21DRAFT_1490282 [Imleria badia]
MAAGSVVGNVAASRDGKKVVSGTWSGLVTVWNAENHEKVTEFKAHSNWVRAVDVSPDGTRIATGSQDSTACVWSLSTGERLLGPLGHGGGWVVAAKFSPNGCLIATATLDPNAVWVYDSRNGRHLVDGIPIRVNAALNNSLAWASDSKQLFVLAHDGNINCLDASTGTTLSTWPIHSNYGMCISLASNGTFIAASAGSSVSFWDTTTREQIGSVIEFTHDIWTMAISANCDLVISGDKRITFRSLCGILPSYYYAALLTVADHIVLLEKNRDLRNELAESERAANAQKKSLNEIIRSLRTDLHTQRTSSDEQRTNLEGTTQRLCRQLSDSQDTINRQDTIDKTIDSLRAILHARDDYSNNEIARLKQINQELRVQLAESQHKADSLIHAHEQKHKCESLYTQGRICDAAKSLMEMTNTINEDVRANKLIVDWLAEFTDRCVVMLERVGDEASNTEKRAEAVAAYSIALSLGPLTPSVILTKWANIVLSRGSVSDALSTAAKFTVPRFVVDRVICEILEGDGRFTEAAECFRQMRNELREDTNMQNQRAQWQDAFRDRCIEKLEKLGDTARGSKKHDEAIERYSNALSLDPTNLDILLKRSNELIEHNPSSHIGYEGKHAALYGMGHHGEAFEAFTTMLSRLDQSPDPQLRELRHQYVDASSAIQKVVEQTIRHMPRVLIDTVTGRLYDKAQQAAAFEELPIYDELRSSMTTRTRLDRARIRSEAEKFYRYVMLSHRWRPNEPTFQMVEKTSIYDLPASPANSKVQRFCELVRYLDFQWAWSDTCCVNQLDKGVQQESLVAMFRWYRGSSLTVVHLFGVWSESQVPGCLWKSIWNTRGWTYQEYIASVVVQFYTEDWKPYLGLDVFNHKESPVILSEMEQAMNFATNELVTLQPGLDKAREKLYLASMRQTTREEDIAYCLFGIFNVALPIIYGEGNQAVGRLLEYILTRSDNVTLLAWTGSSGSHHSYLPADLTVYKEIVPPHVPSRIGTAEMDGMVTALRSSLPDLSVTTALYERLYDLPPLSLSAGRLRLPGIVFPLADLVPVSESDLESDLPVYRAMSPMLGDLEIKTKDQLSGMEGLLLIHPWISPLLDRDFSCGVAQIDLATRALRLVVRLRQSFGALLLAPLARAQYRRVATDSLIMVRVWEETSLTQLMDGIRTIDIQ